MGAPEVPGADPDLPEADGLAVAMLGASQVVLFENLYVAYAAEARGMARAILGDADLAADAVHNGFLELLRYLVAGHRWHDPADARSMVLRNVRWAALNLHRTRRRHRAGVDAAAGEPGDDATWARAEARGLCEEIVGRLNPRHRTAIGLRYVDGLSNIEAARHLGVSVDVFEARLQRALRSARREAHATGLIPGVVALAGGARHLARWRPFVAGTLRRSAVRATSAAAMVTVAACAVAASVQATEPGGPQRAAAAKLVSGVPESIDTATVFDAVALPSGEVLAIGDGHACNCVVAFRSVDGGGTWEALPAPARSQWSLSGGAATGARRAQPCGAAAAPRFCRGGGTDPAQAGSLLTLFDGRLAYFPASGGVLCSVDGGLRWEPRCTPAAP